MPEVPHDLAQFFSVHETKLFDPQHSAGLAVPDTDEIPPSGHVVHNALPVVFL